MVARQLMQTLNLKEIRICPWALYAKELFSTDWTGLSASW